MSRHTGAKVKGLCALLSCCPPGSCTAVSAPGTDPSPPRLQGLSSSCCHQRHGPAWDGWSQPGHTAVGRRPCSGRGGRW